MECSHLCKENFTTTRNIYGISLAVLMLYVEHGVKKEKEKIYIYSATLYRIK